MTFPTEGENHHNGIKNEKREKKNSCSVVFKLQQDHVDKFIDECSETITTKY